MKLELKNIKVCKWASEETHCYQAVVYVNGKPAIEVSNEGHGGSDSQWAVDSNNKTIVDEVNTWCEKTLPKWKGHGNKMYPTDLEIWCGEQVNNYLTQKELKRLFTRDLKSKILFVENDKLQSLSWKKCKVLTEAHFKYFKDKYPQRNALNFMPKDKAIAIYSKYIG